MLLPTSVEPVNAILSTSSCSHQRSARGLAEARHDVEDSGREPHLVGDDAQLERRQRRLLRRLQHHCVPARQRRCDLPRGHEEREVPWDDPAHDAHRLPQRVVEHPAPDGDRLALQLRGPPRIVAERVGRLGNVDPRLPQRLPVIHGFEPGQRFRPRLDRAPQPRHHLAPVDGVHTAPVGVGRRRLPGRGYGPIDIGLARFGHRGDHLAGGRVVAVEGRAILRVDPFAADVELVGSVSEVRGGHGVRSRSRSQE